MIIFRAHTGTYVVDVYVGWGKKFDMGFFWRENSWVGVVITTGDAENSRSRQKNFNFEFIALLASTKMPQIKPYTHT